MARGFRPEGVPRAFVESLLDHVVRDALRAQPERPRRSRVVLRLDGTKPRDDVGRLPEFRSREILVDESRRARSSIRAVSIFMTRSAMPRVTGLGARSYQWLRQRSIGSVPAMKASLIVFGQSGVASRPVSLSIST